MPTSSELTKLASDTLTNAGIYLMPRNERDVFLAAIMTWAFQLLLHSNCLPQLTLWLADMTQQVNAHTKGDL